MNKTKKLILIILGFIIILTIMQVKVYAATEGDWEYSYDDDYRNVNNKKI